MLILGICVGLVAVHFFGLHKLLRVTYEEDLSWTEIVAELFEEIRALPEIEPDRVVPPDLKPR